MCNHLNFSKNLKYNIILFNFSQFLALQFFLMGLYIFFITTYLGWIARMPQLLFVNSSSKLVYWFSFITGKSNTPTWSNLRLWLPNTFLYASTTAPCFWKFPRWRSKRLHALVNSIKLSWKELLIKKSCKKTTLKKTPTLHLTIEHWRSFGDHLSFFKLLNTKSNLNV